MKQGAPFLAVKNLFYKFGFELSKVHKTKFEINGIKYEGGENTTKQTSQGEITALGAVKMISSSGRNNLRILDLCCGTGIIGLTIFSYLKDKNVDHVTLADINIFNIDSVKKTIHRNNLDSLLDDRIEIFLSDGLKFIPNKKEFDLIISNPPHYDKVNHYKDENPLTASSLGLYDPDWKFHEEFYSACHNYLKKDGEVWFIENSSSVSPEDLLPFIESNPNLQYIESIDEELDKRFFWMKTRKK